MKYTRVYSIKVRYAKIKLRSRPPAWIKSIEMPMNILNNAVSPAKKPRIIIWSAETREHGKHLPLIHLHISDRRQKRTAMREIKINDNGEVDGEKKGREARGHKFSRAFNYVPLTREIYRFPLR